MVRALWGDLKKLFGDSSIYLCMLGLGLLYILMYISSLSSQSYLFSIVNVFGEVTGKEILFVSFLLSIVGGSFLYCAEEKHGYVILEVQRIGASTYTASKLLVSVLGGFCIVIAANFIFLAAICVHHFGILGLMPYPGEDWSYLFWEWIVSALRCGMLSAFGFVVSTYVPNYFIAMVTPILIYETLLRVEDYIREFLPFVSSELFFTRRYFVGFIEGKAFGITLLYTVAVLILLYGIAKKFVERRLEHA